MRVGLCDQMAPSWIEEFRRACGVLGLEPVDIAIGAADWMDRVREVDLFVWRLVLSDASGIAQAAAKLPFIENMGIPCFPSSFEAWLYDDKIRETFLLEQKGYPTPRTWVFFGGDEARAFAESAAYPLVAKSHCGSAAGGVQLLRTKAEALRLLDRIFRKTTLWDDIVENYYTLPRLRRGDLLVSLKTRYQDAWPRYAYFQEFLEGNSADYRITALGPDLVSCFTRGNRPGDFRASGSGMWQRVDPDAFPTEACDLALRIARENGFTSMAFDFLKRGREWVVGEMSYAFLLANIFPDNLYRRTAAGWAPEPHRPVGVLHLEALMAKTAGGRGAR